MKVVVVGGGAIGLSCAFSLRRAGAGVTVLDRAVSGQATSKGNGGWITPALSTPLPAPGVIRQALRWMADPGSPLLVRPRLDRAFLSWCWRFARNATPERFESGARALLALNAPTLRLFDEMRAAGVEFEMHERGLLSVSLDDAHVEKDWDLIRQLADLGYPGRFERFDAASVRRVEPALGGRVAGGVLMADERHLRPETLTSGLLEWLRAAGVDVRDGVNVDGLTPAGSGWSVQTPEGPVEADRVVVAAGIWSRALLEPLGTRIPLEAAKGYSVTMRANGSAARHALMLHEAKVGYSPFEGDVRLAGTLELAGEDLSLKPRRVRAIVDAASRYLTDFTPGSADVSWAGLRQLLPDGLPVIGRVPTADGVFVATGHGMLGITLAPATAAALTPLVLEDRLPAELEPLRADRSF
jgi:D-amino-acid dehydrogenase